MGYRDHLAIPLATTELIGLAAAAMAHNSKRAFRIYLRAENGATLRPGTQTPLWNELRRQLRPHLRKRGTQANLARLLGLPRQRVNSFVTGGTQMPDAERTLQLLVWLLAVQQGHAPA